MTAALPAAELADRASRAIVVPAPAPERSPWLLSVAAALAAGTAVGGASGARGQLDLAAALLAAVSVLCAQALGGLVARRAARSARARWFVALDAAEAACDALLESRRRSLRHLWPTSSDLAERLRRGETPRVVGAPSLVVLGVGRVDSGLVLVSGTAEAVVRHERTEALRDRAADLADGPLCVDAAGGVHVRGPALLARSLAGGYRLQLRHRGASTSLVTWEASGEGGVEPGRPGAGRPGGGAGDDVDAACVVEISSHGAVVVVRRDGSACSVRATPAWTSLLDTVDESDESDGAVAAGLVDVPEEETLPRVRPGRP